MRLLWPFVLVLGLGCGGRHGSPVTDAGGTDDAGVVESFVAPPAAPMLACPEGWTDTGAGCEPWPAMDVPACPGGEARFPGSAACAPVGPPCPPGEFAADLPADRVALHISVDSTGGDGTLARPFRNLGEAFAAARGGEVFALGKGRHIVVATFPDDSTFWGACSAETEMEAGFVDEVTGTITAHEDALVEVRSVTIVGTQPGLRAEGNATIDARGVIIDGASLAGVYVLDGAFIAEDLVVRDTTARGGEFGRALQVQLGGRAEIRRAVFERVHDMAVQLVDAGGEAVLEDIAITGVTPDAAGELGRGIEVGTGTTLTIERAVIEDATDSGLFVGGGTAVATDILVRGIRSRPDGEFGRGLHVQEGGSLTAQRAVVDDCRELGVYAAGDGSELTLTDLVVRATRARARDGFGGRGVQLQWGVHATVERAIIDDNVEFGVFVATEGTNVTLRDTLVSATAWHPADHHGSGIEVLLGAELALERVRVENNIDIGFFVSGSTAVVHDLLVVGTDPEPDTGWYGRGVLVTGVAATLDGARVHVIDNTELGVYLGHGRMTLSQVRIEETVRQPCRVDCMGKNAGIGLFVIDSGVAELTDFTIADNAIAGLVLVDGGRAFLTDGSIENHPVGVHATGSADAVLADIDNVAFIGNERNIDATLLPVPDPGVEGEVGF